MKVSDVLKEIAESKPGEWQFIKLPHEDKDVYRYSFNTEIRIEHPEPMGERMEYHADWADDLLGDSKLDTYYIYHQSTPVEVVDAAIVANGNITIPIRNINDGYLSQLDYTITRILNSDMDRLQMVLDTADVEISDKTI